MFMILQLLVQLTIQAAILALNTDWPAFYDLIMAQVEKGMLPILTTNGKVTRFQVMTFFQ